MEIVNFTTSVLSSARMDERGTAAISLGLDVALNFPDGGSLTTRIAGHNATCVYSVYSNLGGPAGYQSYYIYLSVDDRSPSRKSSASLGNGRVLPASRRRCQFARHRVVTRRFR